MNRQPADPRQVSDTPVAGAYAIDITRGQRLGRVSSEWFNRPDDERFLSLGDLESGHIDLVRGRLSTGERSQLEDGGHETDPLSTVRPARERNFTFGEACSPD
ncbi:hypothetical protein [Caulobacter sp. RHG1]|uniref:hypothetical protein n=1 Tax=Caulobacter sp. (strain RHG1) TaxID=2545762 RepID=UPI0019D57725|nr:hypothetical protein [Caulobacter sp. RHG1]NQE64355.1 hypothetical protein [Caulobacter sp. RHG1]